MDGAVETSHLLASLNRCHIATVRNPEMYIDHKFVMKTKILDTSLTFSKVILSNACYAIKSKAVINTNKQKAHFPKKPNSVTELGERRQKLGGMCTLQYKNIYMQNIYY